MDDRLVFFFSLALESQFDKVFLKNYMAMDTPLLQSHTLTHGCHEGEKKTNARALDVVNDQVRGSLFGASIL